MSKRLFVGFFLPREWEVKFEKYKKAFPAMRGMQWTSRDNLHVTLLFIGRIPQKKVAQLQKELEVVARKNRAFEMQFDRFRQAPPHASPSMIWGQFVMNSGFELLARDIKKRFMSITVFEEEPKKVIPHVTLARMTNMPVMENIDVNVKDRSLLIDEFCLIEASSSRDAGKYKIIERYKLNVE